MGTRTLGAALLLASLAGCGGGGASAGAASANPSAGLEDESSATAAAKKPAVAATPGQKLLDPSIIPEPGGPIVRETYAYLGGNRDPFTSVLDGSAIGPELSDLTLVVVTYQEHNPAASVAVLRDRVTGKRYTVSEGERVGRARVSNIGLKDVTFTFDDYGTTRQVTLSIRKREDITP